MKPFSARASMVRLRHATWTSRKRGMEPIYFPRPVVQRLICQRRTARAPTRARLKLGRRRRWGRGGKNEDAASPPRDAARRNARGRREGGLDAAGLRREVQRLGEIKVQGHNARVRAPVARVAPALLLKAGEGRAVRVGGAGLLAEAGTVGVGRAGTAGLRAVGEVARVAGVAHAVASLGGVGASGVAVGGT